MKKHLFSKYIATVLVTCLLGFLLTMGFLALYTADYFSAQEKEKLDAAAAQANFAISTMMDLTRQDFDYLLENERDRLLSAMSLQASDGVGEFLITDGKGRIVIAYPASDAGKTVPSAAMTEGSAMAREGIFYRTDLGGILPEERNCRVLLLEKEFADGHKQRVGAVFLLRSPKPVGSYVEGLLLSFLVAGSIVFLLLILSYYLMTRKLVMPMKQLSEAAASFARGNFSPRLPEEGGDMTPLFRAFNQMADRVEENEKLSQTFVSNVSHDLRTPLTTIGGFLQNMASGAIPPEKQGHYYGIILDEVARLSRLVQTLLETSRMTAGERKYRFAPMDLCELARVTLLSFESRLEAKKLAVSFDCDSDSIRVLADKDAIQQVIYNLLDNAVKFTPDKGVLSLRVRLQGQKAIFCVKNSGQGIPEEELRHLFDRFYKSDRSRGLDKTGMGLGLFIAKAIVAAHGEEIWVESRVGEFTTFLFSLPLTDARTGRFGKDYQK